jgi:hypothetical protein
MMMDGCRSIMTPRQAAASRDRRMSAIFGLHRAMKSPHSALLERSAAITPAIYRDR